MNKMIANCPPFVYFIIFIVFKLLFSIDIIMNPSLYFKKKMIEYLIAVLVGCISFGGLLLWLCSINFHRLSRDLIILFFAMFILFIIFTMSRNLPKMKQHPAVQQVAVEKKDDKEQQEAKPVDQHVQQKLDESHKDPAIKQHPQPLHLPKQKAPAQQMTVEHMSCGNKDVIEE